MVETWEVTCERGVDHLKGADDMPAQPPRRPTLIDLAAFLAVLASGTFMVAANATGQTIGLVAGGMSTLYTTWSVSSRRTGPDEPPRDTQADPTPIDQTGATATTDPTPEPPGPIPCDGKLPGAAGTATPTA